MGDSSREADLIEECKKELIQKKEATFKKVAAELISRIANYKENLAAAEQSLSELTIEKANSDYYRHQ